MIMLRKFQLQNICVIFSKSLLLLFMFSVFCVYIYLFSEFILNYFKLAQCDWPELGKYPPSLDPRRNNAKTNNTTYQSNNAESPLRVMMLADTHLLGLYKSLGWLERKRRDMFLYWSFQAAVSLYEPDVIFMLGDIADQALYADAEEFSSDLQRFYTIFAVPDHIPLYAVVGNHDIGFHVQVTQTNWKRFNDGFNTTDVQLISMKGVHFVTINSVAMHEDDCFMCSAAEKQLDEIELILKCSSLELSGEICENVNILKDYSRPIVLQHFPFFRTLKTRCSYYSLAPASFTEDLDVADDISGGWIPKRSCLSLSASRKILDKIRPRAAFCGHTHAPCTLPLLNDEGIEHTIATFNRRNKPMPMLNLAVFTPDNYATVNCFLPQSYEVAWFTIIIIIIANSIIFLGLVICVKGPYCLGASAKSDQCKYPI